MLAEKESKKIVAKKYDKLEDVAMRNDCVVLYGHKNSEYAIGLWATSTGKLARYSVRTVKQKRIELGLEEPSQEDQA